MASFLLLSKAQLRVIQPLMEFPVKVLSVFCCPANNHQPLSVSWLKPLHGGNQNKAQGATRGSEGSAEWCVGGSAKGWSKERERKKRKVGGHSGGLGRGRIYQQIEWNIVWFRPQSGGSGQEGKRDGEGEWVLVDRKETVGERWREWRSREGWRADRCHSPGPQHRKSFILGSACCRPPPSFPERSQSLQLPNFGWSCDKTAPTQCIRQDIRRYRRLCISDYVMLWFLFSASRAHYSGSCTLNNSSYSPCNGFRAWQELDFEANTNINIWKFKIIR